MLMILFTVMDVQDEIAVSALENLLAFFNESYSANHGVCDISLPRREAPCLDVTIAIVVLL